MGVAATLRNKEGVYWKHRGRKEFGAPIRNVLITTPTMLAIMLPMSFIVLYR